MGQEVSQGVTKDERENVMFGDFFLDSKSKPQRSSQMSVCRMVQKVVSRFAKLQFKVQQICHFGMNMEELDRYL